MVTFCEWAQCWTFRIFLVPFTLVAVVLQMIFRKAKLL